MKLLYFHQHFSTPDGATGTRSYEFARRCIDLGHEVVIVCGSYSGGRTGLSAPFKSGKREGYVDGIYVIEYALSYSNNTDFHKRTWLFILYAIKSIVLAMKMDYDIIFCTSTPLTAGIPGIFARWIRRKTFIFEVRDLWPELPKAMGVIKNPIVLQLMSFLERVCYFSAHRLIGLSPGICDGIKSKGISKYRIQMVSNGCDVDFFNKENDAWLPSGIEKNDFIFIYSGTFGLANGLYSVLDAVVELNIRCVQGYKIILIGQGREKPYLMERIRKEKLDNRILIIDPVPKKKLVALFKSCNVGMQILDNIPAFYYGTSPNKFFDYLSAGLPVLCNYPGWVSDLITNNNCGYVCIPNDPHSFADIIIKFIQSREYITDFRENSFRLAKTEFNRSHLANKWINFVFYGKKI